jgi:hypothetical protein
MSSNMQRLSKTLANRMKATSNAAVPTTMELGKINDNLSLTTDSLQGAIPNGDYMVNLMLTGGLQTSVESHTHGGGEHRGHEAPYLGDHTHGGGDHSHKIPAAFRGLRAGDRVLVAWCGNEPVVIAIVTSS